MTDLIRTNQDAWSLEKFVLSHPLWELKPLQRLWETFSKLSIPIMTNNWTSQSSWPGIESAKTLSSPTLSNIKSKPTDWPKSLPRREAISTGSYIFIFSDGDVKEVLNLEILDNKADKSTFSLNFVSNEQNKEIPKRLTGVFGEDFDTCTTMFFIEIKSKDPQALKDGLESSSEALSILLEECFGLESYSEEKKNLFKVGIDGDSVFIITNFMLCPQLDCLDSASNGILYTFCDMKVQSKFEMATDMTLHDIIGKVDIFYSGQQRIL